MDPRLNIKDIKNDVSTAIKSLALTFHHNLGFDVDLVKNAMVKLFAQNNATFEPDLYDTYTSAQFLDRVCSEVNVPESKVEQTVVEPVKKVEDEVIDFSSFF